MHPVDERPDQVPLGADVPHPAVCHVGRVTPAGSPRPPQAGNPRDVGTEQAIGDQVEDGDTTPGAHGSPELRAFHGVPPCSPPASVDRSLDAFGRRR